MPIYSYKCTACDHRFEARQRFSDAPLSECPVCGASVRKVITPVGIVFKGSGFYVTDNKNGKANSALNGNVPSKDKVSDLANKDEQKGAAAKSDSTSDSAASSSTA